ncbi:class I SAM-dependent methyltransferase [Allorhizobium borbori]|uniref:Glycosyl transferases group 1 n=1 Tax=Allorhizobium borbori TaxID=485907 RepID=A0A7W6K3L6_9HYPH|nr:class I SAM-dependent methyltransferase [Allorhizobium borbori]MBB4104579.1 hypothetical protein [Allorhizobium borbori]
MLPRLLNLGCGKDFRQDAFNIDRNPLCAVDAVLDLETFVPGRTLTLDTVRFGRVSLTEGSFDTIIAHNVLQQARDLERLLDVCRYLLKADGVLDIVVPYDLSFGAWADPANVRAFNEQTFQTLSEGEGRSGWSESHFEVSNLNYVPSAIGKELSERGLSGQEIAGMPRTIDALSAVLIKVVPKKVEVRTTPANSTASAAVPAFNTPQDTSPLVPFPRGWEGHKDRHCIWIVTPPGFVHSQAFSEVAFTLQCAFEELGGSAPIVTDIAGWKDRAPIIYGGNLLPQDIIDVLPEDSVLVNLEQIVTGSDWLSDKYIAILKALPLIDYSDLNRAALVQRGITHAQSMEIGYAAPLTRIAPAPVQDVDVLFYGSLCERRIKILDALKAEGLKVLHLFGVYGEKRDEAIARAKIVLNINSFDDGVFEIVRVSYLLANRVCVVTEGRADDPAIEPFRDGLEVAPFEEIVARCKALVEDEPRRRALAKKGFAAMAARSQAAYLKVLMDGRA